MQRKTLLVIPSLDECYSLYGLCREASKYVDEIIVAEDGSTLTYPDLTKYAKVVHFKHNHGKGYVTRHVLKHYNKDATVFIFMDGDGQHDPKDIPKLLSVIDKHDMVIGYREDMLTTLTNKIGNFFLNFLINRVISIEVKDSQSGFRAIHKHFWEAMTLHGDRYEFEVEMVMEADRHGLNVGEVPITIMKYKKGANVLDGLRIGWFLIKRKLWK